MDGGFTAEDARDLLLRSGLVGTVSELQILPREDRWAIALPGDRMAWFPANSNGLQRLSTERRVLGLLNARCRFGTPRELSTGEGGWDLRALAVGKVDPWGYYARLQNDPVLGARIGRTAAEALAEQHAAIRHDDVAGWLGEIVNWPQPRARLD
jgi:hypothetical protein